MNAARSHVFDTAMLAALPALRRYAQSLCPSIAEDLVQEACAKALANHEKIGSTVADLRAWMCVAARNLCNSVRLTQRRYIPDPDGLYAAHHVVEPHQERYLAFERYRAALAGLSPVQRRSAELVHLLGYSEQEAADEMGVAIGTVKSRLSRASAELRIS